MLSRSLVSLSLLFAILGGCAPEIQAPAAPDAARLVIVTPRPGQVLATHQQATIEARFEPPVDFETILTDAEVVTVRGGERIVIARGDLRPFGTPERLRALWTVAGVPPGEYVVTVKAVAGRLRGEASVPVVVHPAPAAAMRLVSVRRGADGAEVTFAAEATSSVGAAIRDYVWTPGDGGPVERTETPTFTHRYRDPNRRYTVWVEVNDVRGGAALVGRQLDIPAATLLLANTCGCRAMRIRTIPGGNSRTYCTRPPAPERCTLIADVAADTCPEGQRPFRCPLGELTPAPPGQPRLGWTFEVVADLTDETDRHELCDEGQYAQTTQTVDNAIRGNLRSRNDPPPGRRTLPGGSGGADGFTFTSERDPIPLPSFGGNVPFGGPNYGGDDYTIPRDLKRYRPGQIYWLDTPAGPVGRISRTQDSRFITFVQPKVPQGNRGTCWCRFMLRQSWTAREGAQGPGIVLEDELNCSVDRRGLF